MGLEPDESGCYEPSWAFPTSLLTRLLHAPAPSSLGTAQGPAQEPSRHRLQVLALNLQNVRSANLLSFFLFKKRGMLCCVIFVCTDTPKAVSDKSVDITEEVEAEGSGSRSPLATSRI